MTALERSILETVVYFDLLDYPLTMTELFAYLWQPPTGTILVEVEQAVARLPQIKQTGGVVVLVGREKLADQREQRYLESEHKFRKCRRYLWLLSGLPGVEAIWIVNTMAYHNVESDSDIDLLIVARPGKIWSTRFFTTVVAKILRLRPTTQQTKDKLCLSFYVTTAALNLAVLAKDYQRFQAYWLAQIMPVYDPVGLLKQCWHENTWASRLLPLAQPLSLHYNRSITPGWWQKIGHALGRCLLWEKFWRRVQLWILPEKLHDLAGPPETAVVVLSDRLLKFHTTDPRPALQKRFEETLSRLIY